MEGGKGSGVERRHEPNLKPGQRAAAMGSTATAKGTYE